jgi:hypothetical protein
MNEQIVGPEEKEKRFYKFVVEEYMKYGSVDEVFKRNDYNLPISYPGVHRLIDRWGIVKAAGPNSRLSEALTFLVLLSDKKLPLERVYRALPPSFKTSLGTMHRIFHNIKENIVRRVGTALIITDARNPNKILVGEDVSTPRLELGKPFGSISLPMGYSKSDEDPKLSILRILQHEVFTQATIDKQFPKDVIPETPKPLMYLDIADVRVAVYNLSLSDSLSSTSNFSSYKLKNYQYLSFSQIQDRKNHIHLRAGVREICLGYEKYLTTHESAPFVQKSLVNSELAQLALESLP